MRKLSIKTTIKIGILAKKGEGMGGRTGRKGDKSKFKRRERKQSGEVPTSVIKNNTWDNLAIYSTKQWPHFIKLTLNALPK